MKRVSILSGTMAYFISPYREIINVPLYHIASVIEKPNFFGLSSEIIAATYQKHNEPVGLEGKARHELLCQIIMSDWIRLRRYQNQQWSITVNRLCSKKALCLQIWAEAIQTGNIGVKVADIHMSIVITQLCIPNKIQTTVSGLLDF